MEIFNVGSWMNEWAIDGNGLHADSAQKQCLLQVYEMAELLHNVFKILVLQDLYAFVFLLGTDALSTYFESAVVHLDSVLINVQMLLLHTMGSVVMTLLGINIRAALFSVRYKLYFQKEKLWAYALLCHAYFLISRSRIVFTLLDVLCLLLFVILFAK